MLLLISTSDVLSIVTSAATNVDVHASYVDNNAGTQTPLRTNTAISTATATTVVAAPASAHQINVKTLTVRNRDATNPNTITVKLTDGVNNMELIKATLNAGEELIYEDMIGFQVFLATGALKTAFDPTNVSFTGGNESGIFYTPAAGTTSKAPITFVSGTNKTSPAGGEFEYDGVVGYFSMVSSERSVINAEQTISLSATYTLTSQTAAQKLFNSTSNGALTVGGNRTYEFECEFSLSSMSASSGSFGFALGGSATLTSIFWTSVAMKASTQTTATALLGTSNATNANTTLVTANTSTAAMCRIRGIVRTNVGGTIIPQVSLGIAAAAVVGVGARFRCWPIGSGSVTSVGNWS